MAKTDPEAQLAAGPQHGLRRRPPGRGLGDRPRRRDDGRGPQPLRDPHREPAAARRAILGGRGQGHRLGQVRLGPARLAHCMRGSAGGKTALEMLIERATSRFAHGSLLSEEQGIQWRLSESRSSSAGEAHDAARGVSDRNGLPFGRKSRWRSTTSPTCSGGSSTARSRCTARSATPRTPTSRACFATPARSRLVDGADEVHLFQIAQNVIEAYTKTGSLGGVFGAPAGLIGRGGGATPVSTVCAGRRGGVRRHRPARRLRGSWPRRPVAGIPLRVRGRLHAPERCGARSHHRPRRPPA